MGRGGDDGHSCRRDVSCIELSSLFRRNGRIQIA